MTEWISAETKFLPEHHCIVLAKRENGTVTKAYYHRDAMSWLYYYLPKDGKQRLSHFQDHSTLEFLFDVTHWMPLPNPSDPIDDMLQEDHQKMMESRVII